MGKWTRRAVIGTGALAGGGLVLGVTGAIFAPSRHSVNPDTATAQVEGGIMFGLAAAWMGAITINGGKVVESNFHDYQTLTLVDAPAIQVAFIRSDAHIGGLGEPAVPPVAAAVTNAIVAATGIRVRSLPIKDASLKATT